jgi:hypothetical protein
VGSKKNRRDQKRREKQRKRRDKARRVRGSRTPPPGSPGSADRVDRSLNGAEAWPVGECYLSEHWHEHGARDVHAGFVREAEDGRRAAAFFALDLRRDGLTEVLARGGVSEAAIQGEMARRSEEAGHAMLVAEPDLVVKVVLAAVALNEARDADLPSGAREALALFGDLDGSSVREAILTGEPPPAPAKRRSLFSVLFGD